MSGVMLPRLKVYHFAGASDGQAVTLRHGPLVVAVLSLPLWGPPQAWRVGLTSVGPAFVSASRCIFQEYLDEIRFLLVDSGGSTWVTVPCLPGCSYISRSFNSLGGCCIAYIIEGGVALQEYDPQMRPVGEVVRVHVPLTAPWLASFSSDRKLQIGRRRMSETLVVDFAAEGTPFSFAPPEVAGERRVGHTIISSRQETGQVRATLRTPWGRPRTHVFGLGGYRYGLFTLETPNNCTLITIASPNVVEKIAMGVEYGLGDLPPPVRRTHHLVRTLLGRPLPIW